MSISAATSNSHLCLWFPAWPVQRLHVARPPLRRAPLAVFSESSRGRRVVACCSLASAAGVRVGMTLADARSLAGASSLCVRPHQLQADRAALARLATRCRRFSPEIAVEEPDGLLLAIGGSAHLFGGPGALARQAILFLRDLQCVARAAVGPTPAAAWAVARFASEFDAAEPVLTVDDATLSSLPIEALRLSAETTEHLHALGLVRVRQAAALPRDELPSRFGREMLLALDRLFGTRVERIAAEPIEERFEASFSFEHPATGWEALFVVGEKLIGRIAEKLTRLQRGVVRFVTKFHSGRRTTELAVHLYHPTCDAKRLFGLWKMRCEGTLLPGEVDRLEMEVPLCVALVKKQLKLFEEDSRREERETAALVEFLTCRLGVDNVVRWRPAEDHQPERAFRLEPLAGNVARPGAGEGGGPSPFEPLQRPLTLIEPPRPIAVVALAPHGLPLSVHDGGRRSHVVEAHGPEAIDTGWWRGPSVRRAYYRVALRDGRWLWIFRRLQDGRWFVHGAFE